MRGELYEAICNVLLSVVFVFFLLFKTTDVGVSR